MLTALLVLSSNLAQIELTDKEVSRAYGIPMNEEQFALAQAGKPTDFIIFPRRFEVKSCKAVANDTTDCTFKIKWPHGGWHPKQGRFHPRADGTWIADEASRKALYE